MFRYPLLLTFILATFYVSAQNVQIIHSGLFSESSFFNSFTDDGNGTYYAVGGGGIFSFDLAGNVEKLGDNCQGRRCLDIEIDENGKLFFVSDRGISTFNDEGEMIYLYEDFLTEIELGSDGEIYFIGESIARNNFGIYKDGEVIGYTSDNSIIQEEFIHTLEADGLGNVWFAGQDGIYRAEATDFELIHEGQTFDLFIDNKNNVYVVEGSEQLALLSPSDNYAYNTLDVTEVTGRYFVGQPDVHMIAIDGFGNISYNDSDKWEELDVEELGIGKAIPRALYADQEGNILYSKDFDSNIYVFRSGESESEEEEEEEEETESEEEVNESEEEEVEEEVMNSSFVEQLIIQSPEDPWKFLLVYSPETEIQEIEIISDGSVLYSELFVGNLSSINLEGLPSGEYEIKVSSSNDSMTKNITIE